MAAIVQQLVPEVKVFGGISLDYEIGGLNFHALEFSANVGAKMVWMPIHSSTNSRANMRRLPGVTLEGDGFSLLDSSNKLVPEVGRILSIVKKHNMVLANGHISPQETFALVEAAKAIGISKMVTRTGYGYTVKCVSLWKSLSGWGKWGVILKTAMSDFYRPISGTTPSRWWTLSDTSARSTA